MKIAQSKHNQNDVRVARTSQLCNKSDRTTGCKGVFHTPVFATVTLREIFAQGAIVVGALRFE